MKTIKYRTITIKEGDVFYLEGFEIPLEVRALAFTKRYVALVSYGDTDFILDMKTLFNRIQNGSLQPGGSAAYPVGSRFVVPTTSNTVIVQAVSRRKAITTGSTLPQFVYFVQHIDANAVSTFLSLGERQLDAYNRITSSTIRPFPETLDHDLDPIDIGEFEISL